MSIKKALHIYAFFPLNLSHNNLINLPGIC